MTISSKWKVIQILRLLLIAIVIETKTHPCLHAGSGNGVLWIGWCPGWRWRQVLPQLWAKVGGGIGGASRGSIRFTTRASSRARASTQLTATAAVGGGS